MATVLYAPLLGDAALDQVYTSASPTYGTYPSVAQISLLGPVFAPRLYGHDLSSLEIGSSGTVEMTLSDVRALTFGRTGSNIGVATTAPADSLSVTSSNDVAIAAGGALSLSAAGAATFVASGFAFNDVLTIGAAEVTVTGNLNVTGVINSVTVTENTLEVADKVIVLAHGTDAQSRTIADGVANTGAGVVVSGMPEAVADQTAASNVKAFEKSLRWYNGGSGSGSGSGSGMGQLGGDSNVWSSESYWELRGGSLRITNNKPVNDWATDGVVTGTDDVSNMVSNFISFAVATRDDEAFVGNVAADDALVFCTNSSSSLVIGLSNAEGAFVRIAPDETRIGNAVRLEKSLSIGRTRGEATVHVDGDVFIGEAGLAGATYTSKRLAFDNTFSSTRANKIALLTGADADAAADTGFGIDSDGVTVVATATVMVVT
ncbi:hypothetical protein FOA52_004138 [Chlamydomonas sp. UWO 241]|nr:hypothetical protein FOA52_004138 [Chlamydomonas sp. UWO 241]